MIFRIITTLGCRVLKKSENGIYSRITLISDFRLSEGKIPIPKTDLSTRLKAKK